MKNIAYGLRARGIAKDVVTSRAREMAEQIGVSHLLERAPDTLSGGEKQRVALARALVTEPQLLLLDEPLAALDANVRAQMRRLLKDLHQRRKTSFIHVTHDPDEALYLGDRLGVMLNGRLQQVGAPEKVFQQPSDQRVADFLGLTNVLKIEPVTGGVCTVHGVDIHVSAASAGTTHVWIRPEEIVLSIAPFDSSARNQFKCRVTECEPRGNLVAVHLLACPEPGRKAGELPLIALITPTSRQEMGIEPGVTVYSTFKSSAVFCFSST